MYVSKLTVLRVRFILYQHTFYKLHTLSGTSPSDQNDTPTNYLDSTLTAKEKK